MGTTSPDSIASRLMATKRKRSPMSDEHKAALAEGRNQGRAVRRYLEALEAHKPKRGRKRTAESIQKRLAAIDADLRSEEHTSELQSIMRISYAVLCVQKQKH